MATFKPTFKLTFAKRVSCADAKLNVVYYIMLFGMAGLMTFKILYFEEYKRPQNFDKDLRLIMWPEYQESQVKLQHEVNMSGVCKSLHDYEFQWDSTERYRYKNFTCLAPCSDQNVTSKCIDMSTIVQQKMHDRVFAITHAKERTITTQRNSDKDYFFMGVEQAGVGLSYSFSVGPDVARPKYDGSSTKNILTVVMKDKKVVRTIEPQKSIHFSIAELMELAGVEGFLDAENVDARVQQADNTLRGPIGRLSGLQLEFQLDCKNDHSVKIDKKWDASAICLLEVKRTPQEWVYSRRVDAVSVDGSRILQDFHGVEVIGRTTCTLSGFDFLRTFTNLISLLVVIRIPKLLLRFFITSCLGPLSTMYSRSLLEDFDVVRECGRSILRMVRDSAAFVELADQTDDYSMSKDRVAERLKVIFMNQTCKIPPHRVKGLVNLACIGARLESSTIHHMKQDLGLRRLTPDAKQCTINVDSFCTACSSPTACDFQSIAELVDDARQKSVLERIFTPVRLHNAWRTSMIDVQLDEAETKKTCNLHLACTTSSVACNRTTVEAVGLCSDGSNERPHHKFSGSLEEKKHILDIHCAGDLFAQIDALTVSHQSLTNNIVDIERKIDLLEKKQSLLGEKNQSLLEEPMKELQNMDAKLQKYLSELEDRFQRCRQEVDEKCNRIAEHAQQIKLLLATQLGKLESVTQVPDSALSNEEWMDLQARFTKALTQI